MRWRTASRFCIPTLWSAGAVSSCSMSASLQNILNCFKMHSFPLSDLRNWILLTLWVSILHLNFINTSATSCLHFKKKNPAHFVKIIYEKNKVQSTLQWWCIGVLWGPATSVWISCSLWEAPSWFWKWLLVLFTKFDIIQLLFPPFIVIYPWWE